jgi:hypothetical protein
MASIGKGFLHLVARGCVALAGFGIGWQPIAAAAAEPLLGVEAVAAIPTSSSRASTRTGGALHLNGGLRQPLGSAFAVSLLGDGGMTMFESWCGTSAPVCTGDDVTTLLSFTAGPRLSLIDGGFELFFGGRGGVYRGVSGGLTETAGGWALEAGATWELVEGTTAGVVVRREVADIEPSREGGKLEFLAVGLGFEHRFGAPPRAVAQPRSRPGF